jgi:cation:H+ antiporter
VTGVWYLLGATVLLVAGAELFAENAAGASRRLGVSALGIGLLLAGAEPEELITAVIAAVRDRPGLAAGDAIGANLTMLLLLLGLAALVRPVPFGPRVRSYAVLATITGVFALIALTGGGVGRLGGALLVAAYVGFVVVTWRRERGMPAIGELAEVIEREETLDDSGNQPPTPGGALLLLLIGIGFMAVGGEAAITGATRLVDTFEARDTAVGLTVLAFATTAELFALVWAAARRGATELAVAGIVGSAAYNATATLGVAALARPLAVTGLLPAAAAAAALPLVLVAASRSGRLTRPVGVLLVIGYGIFVYLAYR